MQNGLEVRLATIEDLDALESVGDALFDYPIKRNRAMEFLSDSRHHLVLAFNQREVVGMASDFHYVHLDKNPEMFINEVGVVESYQNRGNGRALVKHLWEYAEKISYQEAWGYLEI